MTMPGSPSQVGSRPGDTQKAKVPNSLWPLGATWVQIPPPAPCYFHHVLIVFSSFARRNSEITYVMGRWFIEDKLLIWKRPA